MAERPSITDWIQTIVLVIGVGFALWEFVIRDRDEKNARRVAVRDMISAGQNESIFKAYQALFSFGRQYKIGRQISVRRWDEILHAATPLKEHFLAWANCYSNKLCDQELALKFVCPRVTGYEQIMRDLAAKAGASRSIAEEDYQRLLSECQKRMESKGKKTR